MRNKPSIGKRILAAIALALSLTLAVTVWAALNIRALGRASHAILTENYRSIVAATMMARALSAQDALALSAGGGEAAAAIEAFGRLSSEFGLWLQRERENITIEGEEELAAEIGSLHAAYSRSLSRYLASPEAGKRGEAPAEVLDASEALSGRIEELRLMNERTMYGASDKAQSLASWASLSLSILGAAATAAGLAFGLLHVRRITRPLRELAQAVDRFGSGDYDASAKVDPGDEIGELASGFNAMAAKIRAFHRINVGRLVEEKRKNEAVIAAIDDGLVILDGEFRVANANPAAQAILGFSVDAAKPRHFLECCNEPALFEAVRGSAASGPIEAPDERRRISIERDGAVRHFQYSVAPILGEDRAALGTILLLRDVTKFGELDRLKTEFLMTASHELKTPLTSVRMSLDLLKEEAGAGAAGKSGELIDIAIEEVWRLQALVRDVLDLSTIESGRISLKFKEVSASDALDKASKLLRAQIEAKGAAFEVDAPDPDFAIRADLEKLLWILTNLLANALRYTEAGGLVSASAMRIGGFGHFTVADSGPGIAPDQLERVFEKFVQLRDGKSAGGTGLGLAISREVVRAHGGTIWAESGPGRGSVFHFTIPLAERTEERR